jgi:hypothetical protein
VPTYFAERSASQCAVAALNYPTFLSSSSTGTSPQKQEQLNKKVGFETGREFPRSLAP